MTTMSNPNPERDERVRQIQERLQAVRYSPMFAKSAVVTMESYQAALRDVDTLLSLLDSQGADMRNRCVAKVRQLGATWNSDDRYGSWLTATAIIAKELESLTLDQREREK